MFVLLRIIALELLPRHETLMIAKVSMQQGLSSRDAPIIFKTLHFYCIGEDQGQFLLVVNLKSTARRLTTRFNTYSLKLRSTKVFQCHPPE